MLSYSCQTTYEHLAAQGKFSRNLGFKREDGTLVSAYKEVTHIRRPPSVATLSPRRCPERSFKCCGCTAAPAGWAAVVGNLLAPGAAGWSAVTAEEAGAPGHDRCGWAVEAARIASDDAGFDSDDDDNTLCASRVLWGESVMFLW